MSAYSQPALLNGGARRGRSDDLHGRVQAQIAVHAEYSQTETRSIKLFILIVHIPEFVIAVTKYRRIVLLEILLKIYIYIFVLFAYALILKQLVPALSIGQAKNESQGGAAS